MVLREFAHLSRGIESQMLYTRSHYASANIARVMYELV